MKPPGKILLVATNTSRVPGIKRSVGAWLSEIVYFYHPMTQAGFRVDLASPNGGAVPLDPLAFWLPPRLNRRYLKDPAFMARLRHTSAIRDVNPSDYDCIYFAGGHGPIADYPDDPAIHRAVTGIYEKGGVVAAVCHGPVALLNVRNRDGSFFVRGRAVTGCSNFEEAIIGLRYQVPFLLETELEKRGALYQKSAVPLLPRIVVSERLVTGQNNFGTAGVAAQCSRMLTRGSVAPQESAIGVPTASAARRGGAA